MDDVYREDNTMKNLSKYALLAGAALVAFGQPAQAEDWSNDYLAKERFQVRLRGIGIFADGDGVVNGTSFILVKLFFPDISANMDRSVYLVLLTINVFISLAESTSAF